MNEKENNMNKTHTTTPDVVCKVEWSGNRANAWDTDGVKRTSEITVGCRQKAADGNYLIGRFVNKAGKTYWKKWEGEISTPAIDNSSIEVPTESKTTKFSLNKIL